MVHGKARGLHGGHGPLVGLPANESGVYVLEEIYRAKDILEPACLKFLLEFFLFHGVFDNEIIYGLARILVIHGTMLATMH